MTRTALRAGSCRWQVVLATVLAVASEPTQAVCPVCQEVKSSCSELIVRLKPAPDAASMAAQREQFVGALRENVDDQIETVDYFDDAVLLEMSPQRKRQVISLFNRRRFHAGALFSNVRSMQSNFVWSLDPSRSDDQGESTWSIRPDVVVPGYCDADSMAEWPMDAIGGRAAQARAHAAVALSPALPTPTIAILDSGLHLDWFQNKLWENRLESISEQARTGGADEDGNRINDDVNGANFVGCEPTGKVDDDDGHGTAVAGVIGSSWPSDPLRQGLWNRVKLMSVRVMDDSERSSTWSIAHGLHYAVTQGAELVHMSLQTACVDDEFMREAMDRAMKAGVLVIVASGNSQLDLAQCRIHPATMYPAGVADGFVVVAATKALDERYDISNFGPGAVDLAAPGYDVCTLDIDSGGLWPHNGTSLATPYVTATIALLATLTPTWTWSARAEYVLSAAHQSTRLVGFTRDGRRLDADAATSAPVQLSLSPDTPRWAPGESRTVTWAQRFEPGACTKLVASLSLDGMAYAPLPLVSVAPSPAGGRFDVTLPARSVGSARVRLTCEGTGLHAETLPVDAG